MFKYAFIGAGPAALSAVAALPSAERSESLILELGKSSDRQICPELKSKICSSCFGENCHVLNGLGGSSATFGNKFCHFPASEGLFSTTLKSPYRNSKLYLNNKIPQGGIVVQHPYVPNRKLYDVEVANMDEYRQIIGRLIEDVRSTTEIRTETKVERIEKLSTGGFSLCFNQNESVIAENIVIASGRSGHKDLRRWLVELGIQYSENSPDIGFRIELPTNAISGNFLYQNDPKYKFTFGSLGSGRTFCTCKGGAIVPVKFGAGSFADGAFLRKSTGQTNLALMARTGETYNVLDLEKWCAITNAKSAGGLNLDSFDILNLTSSEVCERIMSVAPDGPTNAYNTIITMLLSKLFGGYGFDLLKADIQEPTLLSVYGPSIDNFWPRVPLSTTFETSVAGIYLIGDAAGYSRGIHQAMTAGTRWAAAQYIGSEWNRAVQ